MADDLESTSRLFKALGDRSRLLIVNELLGGPLSVHEIAERVHLADPTVSFHLSRLAEAGLVSVTRDQQFRIYRLQGELLAATLGELVRIPGAVEQEQSLQTSAYRDKVLQTYIQDGRLLSIPTQLKKRRIVLAVLAEAFEPGRCYAEAEVNEILRRWHADVATLRRELVDEHLLQRDHGIYQRPSA